MKSSLRFALVLVFVGGGACSSSGSSDPTPAVQPNVDAAVPAPVNPAPSSPGDGGADVPEAAVVTTGLPACLGTWLPLVLSGGPHVSLPVGALPSPYAASFLLDYATTGSTIDLTKFAAPGPATTKCDSTLLGQICTFADFDFFGPWGAVTFVTSTASILGTDFLAQGIYTLDYGKKQVLHAVKKGGCSDAALVAAGLAPLSTAGFFASDVSLLEQQRNIDSSAPAGLQVANVPMVPVRIAGTAAIAQLDTGFDDSVVAHSINVNVPFFDAINGASKAALVRDAAHDLTLSTCAGVAEPVEAYHLAAGQAFDLVGPQGTAARSWTSATIFVKRTPAAAMHCGGIGTLSVPAAQIGTSFFADAGAVVFDPFTSRVWIGR